MKKIYTGFLGRDSYGLSPTKNHQKPKFFRFISQTALGALLLLGSKAAYSQTYQPLAVTGFNQDVIANGIGIAGTSTTTSVDNSINAGANFAFLSLDYQLTADAAALTYGLPVNGQLTSPNLAGLTYTLMPYTGNNSLRLPNQNDFGTLTLATPVQLSSIYLAASSGDGSSTISVEILFSDGSSQTLSNISVTNWDDAAPAATPAIISNIGRVKRTTGVASTGNFKLFQITVPVELANQSKLVSGVKITKTDTGAESKIPNIFAVSGKTLSACPVIASASGAPASFTTATLSWALGSYGTGGTTATYTAEVYTDAAYTTPVTGSPFTGITGTSQTISGLMLDTTYYYKIKANNGTCDSEYITGSFTQAYCAATKTGTGTAYYINSVSTTGGYTNINNNTGTTIASSGYTNFAGTQIVSKPAGTSFNYSVTRNTQYTSLGIWVDWNSDLDFDDAGENIHYSIGAFGLPTVVNGTITIPAGTALGNYRMRVRSSYYFNTTLTACGGIATGEAEDYTIQVVTQPADCVTPDVPAITAEATGATISGTITAPATAPSGYILVRSSEATLTAQPVTGASYAVGTTLGNGTVIASGATVTSFSNFVAANTRYYYFVYAYNEGGLSCFGPKYSTAATANATTCAKAVQSATASNITNASATLNWSSIVGMGGAAATYTVEVYTDAALTALLGTYTTSTNTYALTGLTNGTTYWYHVKGETTGCDNDAWSATSSFIAQNSYTPLNVTGYNADVIANGTGIANVSTTNAVDAVNNSYIALDYERISGTVTTFGLPLNRTLTSAAITGLKFLMADYGGNNAIRLPAQNQSATFTVTTPVKLTDVYLALTSGSGTSTISAQLQFQDGTTQAASTFTLIDWYQAGTAAQPALISNIGRANRADNTGNVETGNSKVFYVTLPVDAANQSKLVSGVILTKTSVGATEPVPNVFAVSGKAIEVCPVLTSATATGATGTGATINWVLSATGAAAASYTVEIYTDATFTTPVASSPFTGITSTTYAATGLNALTTYYFRVKALNAECTSAYQTGSFTTLCVAPAAPTATAQIFCGGATVANLTATGVTGATITWYATATSTTPIAASTVLSTGLYFASQTISTCESTKTAVSVTVNTTAAPVAAAQAFCNSGTVSQLVATTLPGATVTWSTTQGGAALTGTEALVSGNYYVTQTLNGCTSAATMVTVTVGTTAAPTATAQAFCTGATASQLVATGATGAVFTWYATQGGTALMGTELLATGTYYVTQTVNGCVSVTAPVVVTINNTAAPTASAQTFCAGATAAELTATTLAGATVTWSATQGGAALTGTEALATGTYYVTQSLNGCVSTAAPVTVTVNPVTPVPLTAAQNFCAGATAVQLAATAQAGATLTWSATQGGTALAGTETLASGTYYVTQTVNGCVSAAVPVTVMVNPIPVAPVAAAQTFCSGATASQLVATGEAGATFNWFATNDGGGSLEGSEALVTGTYYVSQSVNGCTSPTTAVSVTVNTTAAPVASAQTFCEGATASQLTATTLTGATVVWEDAAGVAVTGTSVLASGSYFISQSVNGCESTATEVVVTINPIPAAPTGAATQALVEGDTVADLEFTSITGATINWYVQNSGGELLSIPDTTVLEDGVTYYATQTTNGCESLYYMVTVSLTAGVDGFALSHLVVYPNPTHDVITITNSNAITTVAVTNLLGQTVLTQNVNAETTQVNLSGLAAGTYILQVANANASTTVKIVKQ